MSRPDPFKGFHSSPESIRLAVMLHVRFPLSLRHAEDLLHERVLEIRHETARYWWRRFGTMFAAEIRKRRIDGMTSSRWRMRSLQKFVAVHASVYNHFNQERSLSTRPNFKLNHATALAEWRGLCAA